MTRRSPGLLTAPLPEAARRLFWSWPGGRPPDEEWAVVAVLLAEGGRREWSRVDVGTLAACVRELPLPGPLREAWARYAGEEVAMAGGRERVMDDAQRRVLRVAATVLPAFGFELGGGTALAAAYLGHRRSEDLDLFTGEREIGPALEAFRDALRREGLAVEAEPHHVGRTFARLFVGARPVKVELGCDSPFHIRPSTRTLEGMPVRSLEDLAAVKVLALFGRAEARDFVDVYQLVRTHFDWSELLDLARRKDPGFREEWFVRALQQVDRVGPGCVEPLMPLDFDDLRSEFVRAAARLIRRAMQSEEHEGGAS